MKFAGECVPGKILGIQERTKLVCGSAWGKAEMSRFITECS